MQLLSSIFALTYDLSKYFISVKFSQFYQMKRKFLFLLIVSVLLSILLMNIFDFCFQRPEEYLVSKVIDGDTIELENGKAVRLLGIDTPEKNELFYEEAKNTLKQLVDGKRIVLVRDLENKDKYGRLLRYVFVGKIFVNVEIVKKGYSISKAVPTMKYFSEFNKAEKKAREEGLGIWK